MERLCWLLLLGGALGGLGLSSCTTEAYCFVCEDDGIGAAGESSTTRPPNTSSATVSGGLGIGGTRGTGGTAGGEAGEGGAAGEQGTCTADVQNDPRNCGRCGVVCNINGAVALCVQGECTWEDCRPGREDFNTDPLDGCEAFCNESNDGVEICDKVDNDCDGQIDEDFDLTTVENCGACNNECVLPNATPACEEVNDRYVCRVDECAENYHNFDGSHDNGCEKLCIESNDGQEICDGRDNDCDGQIDEETPGAGMDCDEGLCPWHPDGLCLGPCENRGVTVCSGNQLICVPKQNAPTQSIEVCDGIDNDCDGVADEDFPTDTDVNNCGECGNVCDVPNAFARCVGGECEVDTCRTGYNDLDPDEPGCEYECPESVNDEVCDGIDNDCDGEVDEPADMAPPTTPCLQTGPCSGAVWYCDSDPDAETGQWLCNYQERDARIEVDPTTVWPAPEMACDNFDNNCDGYRDEGMGRFQFCTANNQCVGNCSQGRCSCTDDSQCDFGYGCSSGFCVAQCFDGIGECQDTALVQCAGDGDGIVCPAQAITANAEDETCDGLDNNCDGQIDESTPAAGNMFSGVADDVVFIENGSSDYYIYKYEASRPDSASDDAGVSDTRSCSREGVQPWTSVNQAEAAAACAAAGMRLCTQTEWERACDSASSSTLWSFSTNASTYRTGVCNDVEHSRNASEPSAWPTGDGPQCFTDSASGDIYDMSGNVSEWTSTQAVVNGNTYYRVRGGNYTSYGPATACNFSFVLDVPTFANADLGFRCCGANPPNIP